MSEENISRELRSYALLISEGKAGKFSPAEINIVCDAMLAAADNAERLAGEVAASQADVTASAEKIASLVTQRQDLRDELVLWRHANTSRRFCEHHHIHITATDCRECLKGSPGCVECADSDGVLCDRHDDSGDGIYQKYVIRRLDDPEGKHDDCDYFVLDWQHDPFAAPAALAYADVCESEYPALAQDLRARASAELAKSRET